MLNRVFLKFKTKFSYLLFLTGLFSFSQSYELLNTQNFKGGYLGFSSFVDYNNDGYLDVFTTGLDFDNRYDGNLAVLYENNGDKTFTISNINTIPRVIYGDYSWADYDNNGTLDLLYSGTTSGFSEFGITKLFSNSNQGCDLVEVPLNLPGITRGATKLVDIDNDGLLDIFLAGINQYDEFDVFFFKNNGNNTFNEIANTTIIELSGGRGNGGNTIGRWKDLDGDGLEDLILGITTRTDYSLEIYKNLGGFQFERQDMALPRLSYVSMEIEDMTNDGRPDIVLIGSQNLENFNSDGVADLLIYSNEGNMNFTNTFSVQDQGVFISDIALGDIDNNGFIDILNYGTGPRGTLSNITKMYINTTDGSFVEFNHGLPNCSSGGALFGDFDGDSDDDILYFGRIQDPLDNEITYIYENNLIDRISPTDILFSESCSCDNSISFTLNNATSTILWNFGDPATGTLNTATETKASHVFSNDGNYTVSATYTQGGITNTLTKTITINGLPTINQPENLTLCSSETNTEFNFNELKDTEILNGVSLEEFEVFYYKTNEQAEQAQFSIAMPYINNNENETIFVRVQSIANPTCFLTTSFNILFEAEPVAHEIPSLSVCDNGNDGIAIFNLNQNNNLLVGSQNNVTVSYLDANGNNIDEVLFDRYENRTPFSEMITARVTDNRTNCFAETSFLLQVNPLPVITNTNLLIGCDIDGNGISENFDTSLVADFIVGTQTNLKITYYNAQGNILTELPDPYTNTIAFQETLTARVFNTLTGCYAETTITFETTQQPKITEIIDQYACDMGDGYAVFDTSDITENLIGNQLGLSVSYLDENGHRIEDFITDSFRNQTPYEQRIFARIESKSGPECFTETSFRLVVQKLPIVALEDIYYLCATDISLALEAPIGFESYSWMYEDDTLLSNMANVTITQEGNYSLNVMENNNGLICEQSYFFRLERSDIPEISDIAITDISKNNSIEIFASGGGNLEYSIDGFDYSTNNKFTGLLGGNYTVYVRDKNGCGEASSQVFLLDYPKFFTPNNDTINDTWQIIGGAIFPDATVTFFDRYTKLIFQCSASSEGWNGTYLGKPMPSDDYWFKVDLKNGRTFSGHFTLKR